MKKILILFFIVTTYALAQTDTTAKYNVSDRQLFGFIGIGEGTIGYQFNSGVQFIKNSHTFTARYIYSREGRYYDITPPPQDDDNGHPVPYIHEFAAMYGYSHIFSYEKFPANLIQVNAGIGGITASTSKRVRCLQEIFGCEYDEIRNNTFGFAYSVQAIQTINKNFGLGVNFYGNINNSLKINGASLSLCFGKMY